MTPFPGLIAQLKKRDPWAIAMVAWFVICGPVFYFTARAIL